MKIKTHPEINLIPCSATGYNVIYDESNIGIVTRNTRERDFWWWDTPNGGHGSVGSCTKAVEVCLAIWRKA